MSDLLSRLTFYGRNNKIKKAWNHPTNWPPVPEGWSPRPDWTPPLDWPAAPEGWEFYVEVNTAKKVNITTNSGPLPPRVLYASATTQAAMIADTAPTVRVDSQVDIAPEIPVVDLDATDSIIEVIKTLPFISGATKKQISDHLESLSEGYLYVYGAASELETENARLAAKAETINDLLNTLLSQIQSSNSNTAELASLKLEIENWKRSA